MKQLASKLIHLTTTLALLFTSVLTPIEAAALREKTNLPGESTRVRQLTPPPDLGTVVDAHFVSEQDSSSPLVIHIQNLHANYEAQTHIAKLLEYYDSHLPSFKVAVEGAEGPIQVAELAKIPDVALKTQIGTRLLKAAEINGAEYFSIIKGKSDVLWGVEDERSHQANLSLFKATYKGKEELARALSQLQKEIEPIKQMCYTRAMKKMEAKERAYNEGTVSLAEYTAELVHQASKIGIPVGVTYPEIAKGVGSARPESYADIDQLLTEEAALLKNVQMRLAETDQQRNIASIHSDLDVLKRFVTEQVTCQEVRHLIPELPQLLGKVQHLLDTAGISYDKQNVAELASQSLDFYAIALLRDTSLAENTLKMMSTPAGTSQNAILVTGGFHTPGITKILKEKKVSYIVIAPVITAISPNDRKLYVARLMGEHTPMNELVGTTMLEPDLNAASAVSEAGRATGLFTALRRGHRTARTLLSMVGGSVGAIARETAEQTILSPSAPLVSQGAPTLTVPLSAQQRALAEQKAQGKNGKFGERPGGNWQDAMMTILGNPSLLQLLAQGQLTLKIYGQHVPFPVSESTMRRDFAELEKMGYLKRSESVSKTGALQYGAGTEILPAEEIAAIRGSVDTLAEMIWTEELRPGQGLRSLIRPHVESVPGITEDQVVDAVDQIHIQYREVMQQLRDRGFSEQNLRRVNRSFALALWLHRVQRRATRDSRAYFVHSSGVKEHLTRTLKVLDLIADQDEAAASVGAAFLHDSVEDVTKGTLGLRAIPDRFHTKNEKEVYLRMKALLVLLQMAEAQTTTVVQALTKPIEGSYQMDEQAIEMFQIRSLASAPLASRLLKMADWLYNFGDLQNASGGAFTAGFVKKRLPYILEFIREMKEVSPETINSFIDHVIDMGELNNRINAKGTREEDRTGKRFAGPTLTAEQTQALLDAKVALANRPINEAVFLGAAVLGGIFVHPGLLVFALSPLYKLIVGYLINFKRIVQQNGLVLGLLKAPFLAVFVATVRDTEDFATMESSFRLEEFAHRYVPGAKLNSQHPLAPIYNATVAELIAHMSQYVVPLVLLAVRMIQSWGGLTDTPINARLAAALTDLEKVLPVHFDLSTPSAAGSAAMETQRLGRIRLAKERAFFGAA